MYFVKTMHHNIVCYSKTSNIESTIRLNMVYSYNGIPCSHIKMKIFNSKGTPEPTGGVPMAEGRTENKVVLNYNSKFKYSLVYIE